VRARPLAVQGQNGTDKRWHGVGQMAQAQDRQRR